jgi:hypothetical protein
MDFYKIYGIFLLQKSQHWVICQDQVPNLDLTKKMVRIRNSKTAYKTLPLIKG